MRCSGGYMDSKQFQQEFLWENCHAFCCYKNKNSTKYYCENFNTILLDGYTMIGSKCAPITCVGGVSGARV